LLQNKIHTSHVNFLLITNQICNKKYDLLWLTFWNKLLKEAVKILCLFDPKAHILLHLFVLLLNPRRMCKELLHSIGPTEEITQHPCQNEMHKATSVLLLSYCSLPFLTAIK